MSADPPPPPPLKVLVVGASIAGPTTAYWLARAGADVTVVERYPSLRPGGQNVDIRLTGVTVMRRIPGMEEAVRAVLAPVEGMAFVGADDDKPIAVMRGTGDAERQSLVSEFEIFRGDLSRILYDLSRERGGERVRYIFGEQIASMQQQKGDERARAREREKEKEEEKEGDDDDDDDDDEGGPVRVEFANGTPAADFDLVVACDGATSRTRAMGLGCGVRDHVVPLGAWAAYYTIPRDVLAGGRIGLAFSAPGGRALGVEPDRSSSSSDSTSTTSNRVIAMSAHTTAPGDAGLETFRAAQREGVDAVKRLVAETFGDMAWRRAAELVGGAAAADNDFYASEWCQVRAPTLRRGRWLALVGDAGYAAGPVGTGTSLAMAGAYVLAGEIASRRCRRDGRRDGGLGAALAAYERRMAPMVRDMQVVPPGVLAMMAPQTAWGIWLRNLLFRLACWGMQFSGAFSWVSSLWAAGFGRDKYDLPDYDWPS
ncbi:hypothetical protein GGR56DRAFT_681401 [Xylariaceae sp. FL0804]|nr:hypothetical protein GGR56DRAFT_681401 [Xylariaceae sp. FL0804]